MKIGIIGGGWTGLLLAHHLKNKADNLVLLEKADQLGGLATYHDFGQFYWDRFYHVILPTDQALLEVLDEMGLTDCIEWKQTRTGVYVDQEFHSMSTSKEFLFFPPLNLFQKFRLGLTILVGSRINDWRQLEKISSEDWLVKYSGRATYEKFWKPLLMAKLGQSYQRVSAVFIWTYIKRLFEARESSSAKKEQMGYVRGSYKTVFDALERQLREKDVRIRTQTNVEHIEAVKDGGLWVTANGQKEYFDKLIFTGPASLLSQLADKRLYKLEGDGKAVEYLGVVCMVLVLKRELTPFYVLNIADEAIPFTGVIGMSSLVDVQETDGKYMVYLPKYVLSTDPFFQSSDEEIRALFFEGLHRMYPDFKESDVVSVHINRARKVQPLQVLNYSKLIPQVKTRHPDFFVLNTAQFVNNTLNNNSVAQHVKAFVEQHAAALSEQRVEEKVSQE